MRKFFLNLPKALVLSAPLMAAPLMLGTLASGFVATPAAAADLASAKAIVDSAKAAGTVGEQADGYLGLVTGSADAGVQAAVHAINAGRAAVYRQTAAKSGVSPEAAGEATGKLLIERTSPGQFYKPTGKGWMQKS